VGQYPASPGNFRFERGGDTTRVDRFEEDEITALFGGGTEGLTDPDEVPEAPRSGDAAGDLIVLGNHRLLCGMRRSPRTSSDSSQG